jgi:hypothetical protein
LPLSSFGWAEKISDAAAPVAQFVTSQSCEDRSIPREVPSRESIHLLTQSSHKGLGASPQELAATNCGQPWKISPVVHFSSSRKVSEQRKSGSSSLYCWMTVPMAPSMIMMRCTQRDLCCKRHAEQSGRRQRPDSTSESGMHVHRPEINIQHTARTRHAADADLLEGLAEVLLGVLLHRTPAVQDSVMLEHERRHDVSLILMRRNLQTEFLDPSAPHKCV